MSCCGGEHGGSIFAGPPIGEPPPLRSRGGLSNRSCVRCFAARCFGMGCGGVGYSSSIEYVRQKCRCFAPSSSLPWFISWSDSALMETDGGSSPSWSSVNTSRKNCDLRNFCFLRIRKREQGKYLRDFRPLWCFLLVSAVTQRGVLVIRLSQVRCKCCTCVVCLWCFYCRALLQPLLTTEPGPVFCFLRL